MWDHLQHLIAGLAHGIERGVLKPALGVVEDALLTPIFLGMVALVLVLEMRMPARPRQKLLSAGFAHDVGWVFVRTITRGLFISGYVALLQDLYQRHFAFLTVESVRDLPVWLRVVWGVVLLDFLRWTAHFLQHQVSWFWEFHAVHHSQRELNLFSDFRTHFFEYFVRNAVVTFPMLALSVDRPRIVALSLLLTSHACFYHSNIRMGFGPLRYVFVNPQSHRIHHSIEPQHRNRNYGALFTWWDYLFGTQYRRYDEYPETGIPDLHFPVEESAGLRSIFSNLLAQNLYPFRVVAGRLLHRSGRSD